MKRETRRATVDIQIPVQCPFLISPRRCAEPDGPRTCEPPESLGIMTGFPNDCPLPIVMVDDDKL